MAKIALIEDNPDNRMLLVALLEDDHEVVEYDQGQAALDAMPDLRPDIILLDISLPGLDGTEVLKQLKAGELASIPTVALTAHAMDGDRERFLSLGFDAYLSKPIVDENDLFDLIDELVSRS